MSLADDSFHLFLSCLKRRINVMRLAIRMPAKGKGEKYYRAYKFVHHRIQIFDLSHRTQEEIPVLCFDPLASEAAIYVLWIQCQCFNRSHSNVVIRPSMSPIYFSRSCTL